MKGLFVLVCSNGAKVGRLTYEFKRKHTAAIGTNELKGFIQDSIHYVEDRVDHIESKVWSSSQQTVIKQFEEITTLFPKRKDSSVHPAVIALNSEFGKMEKVYSDMPEFALFMAVTNMSSRPNEYGLSSNYARLLDGQVSKLFFN
ncbi:MAG: hypothetical protein HW421_554 [Ignavibacteria bacterium]|nr:hypothetical protein [Ignavibacteria bacterium]